MKKNLICLVTLLVAFTIFAFLTKSAEADKPVFGNKSAEDKERVKQISLDILRERIANRAVGNTTELKAKSVEFDHLNMAHTRVRQTIGEIPVWEGEAIVHLKADGSLSSITDELKESLIVDTNPTISSQEALKIAQKNYGGTARMTEQPTADLWIYRGEFRDHLTYRVEMPRLDGSEDTSIPVVFIDAQTGENVFEYNNLQTAGTGSSLYSGTVAIDTSSAGKNFYMEDLTRKLGTFNMNNTGDTTTGTGGTQSRYTGTDDVWSATNERAGVDAHHGARLTFDYFQSVHNRNGIDGNFGPGTTAGGASSGTYLVSSRVHFGRRYNNAFWYQNKMSYGDGDGTNYSPLVTLDICGHEMTHGITERTAKLTYSNESGALNESMSDVFGAMVELYADGALSADTWKIGEDAYTPKVVGDALRRMDNPQAAGDPDHYSLRYTGTADSGGVHTNSGIGNHAFYLIAIGGTNRVSNVNVTGIGVSDAAKIWYRALTVYMTSGTNFAGARTATIKAANDIFGSSSTQTAEVAKGWCAVGIGACSIDPSPTPTATPTPGENGELISNGSFETTVSPWVGSGNGFNYTDNGPYSHTGTGFIYFGYNNNVSGQAYQTISIPNEATGTLTFWLNVTSSETTATTQYDKMYVEVRDSAGALLSTVATFSNLDKGTGGVYSQKSFNLAGYNGQTIRLQFHSTTDSSLETVFRIDDVSLR